MIDIQNWHHKPEKYSAINKLVSSQYSFFPFDDAVVGGPVRSSIVLATYHMQGLREFLESIGLQRTGDSSLNSDDISSFDPSVGFFLDNEKFMSADTGIVVLAFRDLDRVLRIQLALSKIEYTEIEKIMKLMGRDTVYDMVDKLISA